MKLPLARSYFPQTIDRIHRGVRLGGFVKGRHGSSSLETIVLRNAYTQLTTFSSEFRSESKLPLLHATESSDIGLGPKRSAHTERFMPLLLSFYCSSYCIVSSTQAVEYLSQKTGQNYFLNFKETLGNKKT